MKTSEVLRIVRTHLGEGSYGMHAHKRYICYALNVLYGRGMVGDVDRMHAKRVISAHLDGCSTLEHWLLAKHKIECAYTVTYLRKIMATRKAWLTHLIEHYEAKGD